jgi:hypothetical protein
MRKNADISIKSVKGFRNIAINEASRFAIKALVIAVTGFFKTS